LRGSGRVGIYLFFTSLAAGAFAAPTPRYPAALALDPQGRWLFSANESSGSVSVLDLERGEVAAETVLDPEGRPAAIAVSERPDRTLLVAVSEQFVHRVSVLGFEPGRTEARRPIARLDVRRRVGCGRLPRGLAFTPEGSLLVASSGEGEVWEIDVDRGAVVRRIAAVEGVRALVVMEERGGRAQSASRIVAAGRTELAEIDLRSGGLLSRRALSGGKAFNLAGLAVHGGRAYIAHQVKPTEVAIDPQMVVWGLVIANRVTALALAGSTGAAPLREDVFPLDQRHLASGDPAAIVAVDRSDEVTNGSGTPVPPLLLVVSAGTDRLLFLDLKREWAVSTESLSREEAIPAVRVPGRPGAVALDEVRRRAYVAAYLDDAVHEVDIGERKLVKTLRLGPPPASTAEHEGARLFHDARRSRGGWYSCQSCHPDGGTGGHRFDTSADGGGLAKKAPSLRGTGEGYPWSWIGRFETLEAQVAASIRSTMAVDEAPDGGDVAALAAFLRSLKRPHPTRPGEDLGGSPTRGAAVFEEAGCGGCHGPPSFTSPDIEDAGVADEYDGRRRFNPPALRGVRDGFRFLHDARAASLREVFDKHDALGRHGRASEISPAELDDLIAYLKTL
jgi:cytochrome c peroxidase